MTIKIRPINVSRGISTNEVGVIPINLCKETQVVDSGTRITQMIVLKVERVEFEQDFCLTKSERDAGEFGSSRRTYWKR